VSRSDAHVALDTVPAADPSDAVSSKPEAATHPVLTVDELAELLRCNRKTVYAAIARGEIPGVRRLGGAIRIHRDTVLTWLGHGQVRAPGSRSSR
jgi:excisionase family DNA binding protein